MPKDNQARYVVKQVDKAVLYSDGTILLKDVRASYPHIGTPYKGDDGKGKHGIVALMPKKAPWLTGKDLMRDEIRRLIKEAKLNDLPAANKFLRDGNLAGKEEYEGMFTINASEVRPPIARDNVRDPKTGKAKRLTPQEADSRFYAGCWVNILIKPWFQNNKFGKKVNAGLAAIQFLRDDEQFGEGRIGEDDVDETFDEFTDEDSGFADDGLGEEDEL